MQNEKPKAWNMDASDYKDIVPGDEVNQRAALNGAYNDMANGLAAEVREDELTKWQNREIVVKGVRIKGSSDHVWLGGPLPHDIDYARAERETGIQATIMRPIKYLSNPKITVQTKIKDMMTIFVVLIIVASLVIICTILIPPFSSYGR